MKSDIYGILTGGCVMLSCSSNMDSVEPPPIEWVGERLSFGADPETRPVCNGTLEYMDGYILTLSSMFGLDTSTGVEFYYVGDKSRLGCGSGHGTLACTRNNTVFSLVTPQEHELVHAVRSYADFSHFFLEEGAAEYWGDDSRSFSFRTETDGDLLSALAQTGPDGINGEHYGLAGRFYAFLATTQSDLALNSLLKTTDRTTSFMALEGAFETTFGQSLATIDAEFQRYEICEQAVFRTPAHTCSTAREVTWCADGKILDVNEMVACSDPETIGPRDGEIWKYLTIDIQVADRYAFLIRPEENVEGAYIELKRCAGGCNSFVETIEVPSSATPATFLDLEPGRYVLRLTRPIEQDGMFSFFLRGGGCEL